MGSQVANLIILILFGYTWTREVMQIFALINRDGEKNITVGLGSFPSTVYTHTQVLNQDDTEHLTNYSQV